MAEHRKSEEEAPIEVTPAEARQGTGPRDMVTVLTVSLLLATAAGAALLVYYLA